MPLESGTKLNVYEIVEPIGAGGMGEVYRARDTKLDRDVAIKVLPEEFARDEERLARFEREAKLLASLNHPNIASIYGFEESDGVKALALELVEGPTLAERIARGPIPVEETIEIAKQIASALFAGHGNGVVHRDLKPANIKLQVDGTVKVLDYGLAKALDRPTPDASRSDLSQSPTLTRNETKIGVVVGTAPYMSPEQAKGQPVDARTDIFSFGAVVYEMLSGIRAFSGGDVTEVLAAILKDDPNWDALPYELPDRVARLVVRCLAKKVQERVQSVSVVSYELSEVLESPVSAPAPRRNSSIWFVATVFFLAGAIVSALYVGFWREPEVRRLARVHLSLDPFHVADGARPIAIAPDASAIVFSGATNDGSKLFVRYLNEFAAKPIPDTEGGFAPFFAPDGRHVGFFTEDSLATVSLEGGLSTKLAQTTRMSRAASWGTDDTIVYTRSHASPLLRVSASGGAPEELTVLDADRGEFGHRGPVFLPDGSGVVFTIHSQSGWFPALYSFDSDTVTRFESLVGGSAVGVSPSGHLVYTRADEVFAVGFDPARREIAATPRLQFSGVRTSGVGAPWMDMSHGGSLAFVRGLDRLFLDRGLAWVDRSGHEEIVDVEPMPYILTRVSPDGRRAVVEAFGDGSAMESDLWIVDLDRGGATRLTNAPGRDGSPVWTPDGERIVFQSYRDGEGGLYVVRADGSGRIEPLMRGTDRQAVSISPDGKSLVIEEITGGLSVLSWSEPPSIASLLSPVGTGGARTLIRSGEVSPDGRWILVDSNESGQREIYLRPFPNVDDGRWQVSVGGGLDPAWGPLGDEIFYLGPNSLVHTVRLRNNPGPSLGKPAPVLDRAYFTGTQLRAYGVAPDRKRFLMIKELQVSDDTGGPTSVELILNWSDELAMLEDGGRE